MRDREEHTARIVRAEWTCYGCGRRQAAGRRPWALVDAGRGELALACNERCQAWVTEYGVLGYGGVQTSALSRARRWGRERMNAREFADALGRATQQGTDGWIRCLSPCHPGDSPQHAHFGIRDGATGVETACFKGCNGPTRAAAPAQAGGGAPTVGAGGRGEG